MKRRQISGYGLSERFGPLMFVGLGILFLSDAIKDRTWDAFHVIFLLALIPIPSLMAWNAFKKVHPVFFDENAFYWKKNGVEQAVDFSNVIGLHVNAEATRSGPILGVLDLTYTTLNGTTDSISFYPISLFAGNPDWLIVQCEDAIRAKKPEFNITGFTKTLLSEREENKVRPYKLR